MEEDDDDDIYAPDDNIVTGQSCHAGNGDSAETATKKDADGNEDDGEEEGEEIEEDESDSDIDIITERKVDRKADSVQPSRLNPFKDPSDGTPTADSVAAPQGSSVVKAEPTGKEMPTKPGSSYPAIKFSSIDVDANPTYDPNGKPITEIDMDADFPEDDKPWRRPGTDMTDFFNYGFDEFTWASYCLKQSSLRKEVTDSKKQMEDMQSFLSMPPGITAMPGMSMSGASGGPQPNMPAMGGPADMPPEMQQMMAQMMSQGIDPTQMDPATFMQMMQGGQGGTGGDPHQNFAGQGFGQQGQNQQMGYGFGSGGGGGGGGRNQGGRGNRRW